jgi:predicted nucleic acid-binding protein
MSVSGPISTASEVKTRLLVADRPRPPRGLLDTSVVIDLDKIESTQLAIEVSVSALTMAELAAGPHASSDPDERARRQDRLQRAEAVFDPLPFDADAARAYGRIFAAVIGAGRKARGARSVDLLIAATALAARLPLYTRKGDDLRALGDLLEIIVV